ncbi:MAG: trypsin-like peptidase domain-containing protein [Bacteroidetes bacterium]|nr:trypsin-like peptidase domain-containing protein [Bacteroidota bacterium]
MLKTPTIDEDFFKREELFVESIADRIKNEEIHPVFSDEKYLEQLRHQLIGIQDNIWMLINTFTLERAGGNFKVNNNLITICPPTLENEGDIFYTAFEVSPGEFLTAGHFIIYYPLQELVKTEKEFVEIYHKNLEVFLLVKWDSIISDKPNYTFRKFVFLNERSPPNLIRGKFISDTNGLDIALFQANLDNTTKPGKFEIIRNSPCCFESNLICVGHPQGKHVRISLNKPAFIDKTGAFYLSKLYALPGSSGSPVFCIRNIEAEISLQLIGVMCRQNHSFYNNFSTINMNILNKLRV